MAVRLDTLAFINLSKARYPGQFDYCDARYLSAKQKIIIYCTRHNPHQRVEITPDHHLHRGSGCHACKKQRLHEHFGKGAEAFIKQARKVHGDDFDYSLVDYRSAKMRVEIFCRKHKETFKQTPDVHLRGAGCRLCRAEKISQSNAELYARRRVDWATFLARAHARHNGRYTYLQASYRGLKAKVQMICPVHNEFAVRASNHLAGQGCKKCASIALGLPQVTFEQRVVERYGEQYSYEYLGPYVGKLTPLRVSCVTHGQTWDSTVQTYLSRGGCSVCRRMSLRLKNLATRRRANPELERAILSVTALYPQLSDPEDLRFALFVKRARGIHGQRYSYIRDSYSYDYRRLTIVCERHVSFRLVGSEHLLGKGCPYCAREGEVKAQAIELFGVQRFDYSKLHLSSLNYNAKVMIGCNLHQLNFEQSLSLHLQGFNGCKSCAKNKREKTLAQKIDHMRERFLERASSLHSGAYQYPHVEREFEAMSSKITIYCAKHDFTFTQSATTHVYKNAPGCQRCKGDAARARFRLPYIELQSRVSEQGFTLVTQEEEYQSASQKVKVRCANNHLVTMKPQKIFAGQSCSRCSGYIGETITREILCELFEVDFPKRHFTEHVGGYEWLELDGYCEGLAIGFEYQGAPHHLRRFHKNAESYKKQQARDQQKKIMCKMTKVVLLEIEEFSYPFNDIDIRKRIEAALDSVGCTPPQPWPDPLNHRRFLQHISGRGLLELQELAARQNLEFLDDSWHGDWHSYTWRCLTCKSTFSASYATRRRSKYQCCPTCARGQQSVVAQRKQTLNKKGAVYLENLRRRALELGLVLLDNEWKGSSSEQSYNFCCAFTQQAVAPRTYNNLLKRVLGCRCNKHIQILAQPRG